MISSLLLVATLLPAPTYRQKFPLPDSTVPSGWGVNIHFTQPQPGEMEKMEALGIKWVRMDFFWSQIEKQKGKYDFRDYDTLMGHLERHKIRPIFILDYGNDLYEKGAPKSLESQAAFAKFVKASVNRFKGKGVLWEMWNEPNLAMFWQPEPSVDLYTKLTNTVGKAIRETAKDEWFVGPATSGFDWAFIEGAFQQGVLKWFDAVTVHPYRQTNPESATSDWDRLRILTARYAPHGKTLPLISGEWGYSDAWQGQNPELKANYVVRQYLSNLASGVNLSIYYDWKNDGQDPKEPEHHFGLLMHDLGSKPAAAQLAFVAEELKGFRFMADLSQDILPEPGDEARILLFGKGDQRKLALWSQVGKALSVKVPLLPVKAEFSEVGETSEITLNPGKGITAKGTVRIVTPAKTDAWLRGLSLLPGRTIVKTVKNEAEAKALLGPWLESLAKAAGPNLVFIAGIGAEPWVASSEVPALPKTPEGRMKTALEQVQASFGLGEPVTFSATLNGPQSIRLTQTLVLEPEIPLSLQPGAIPGQLVIENPKGWKGVLTFKSEKLKLPVTLDGSVTQGILVRPADAKGAALTLAGKYVSAAPLLKVSPLWAAPPTFQAFTEGDVKGEVKAVQDPPGTGTYSFTNRFPAGWCYSVIRTDPLPPLSAGPDDVVSYGVEVFGDESGSFLRSRFVDSMGQTFQPNGIPITWKGWKLVRFAVSNKDAGWWGGPADGIIHWPVKLETLLLVDSPKRLACETNIRFRNPHIVSRIQISRK